MDVDRHAGLLIAVILMTREFPFCCSVVQNVIEHQPRPYYLLAVDMSNNTMEELVKVRNNPELIQVNSLRNQLVFADDLCRLLPMYWDLLTQ